MNIPKGLETNKEIIRLTKKFNRYETKIQKLDREYSLLEKGEIEQY